MQKKIIVPKTASNGYTRREFLKFLEIAGISVAFSGAGVLSASQNSKNQLAGTKEIITRCGLCGKDCGMKAYVKDNIIKAVGPWEEDPISKGFLCDMGLATPEIVHAPDRILSPLKRKGGKFVEIGWDEALAEIAEKLGEYKSSPGPESVVFHYGVSQVRDGFYRNFIRRFCDVYGSPNFTGCGSQCHVAGAVAKKYSIGSLWSDYENSRYIVQWGCNPATSSIPTWLNRVLPAKESGAKLVCIDPRPGAMTRVADRHLSPKPGTDGALALAVANIIIQKKLYAEKFVKSYGLGFDEYKKLASAYPVEKAAAITGIPADDIQKFAVEYATSGPACISTGNALELHLNGVQTIRSIQLLQALTGNIDIKGGNMMSERKTELAPMDLKEIRNRAVPGITEESYPLLWKYHDMVSANKLPETILTGKPYPIKALLVVGGNPLSTGPNVSHQREAFKKLDLMVVMDLFMTETAKMADIVLPAATFMECDGFKARNSIFMTPKVIPEQGKAWPTWKFWFELAKTMGYTKEFPWQNLDEAIDEHLKPVNLTAAQLRKNFNGVHPSETTQYRKYEKRGLDTPSKKIEFSSPTLKKFGYDPLPVYVNPYENYGNKELQSAYPFIMNTGGRIKYFYHSQYHNIPSLLKKSPEPMVEINPEDAASKGISNGDAVRIISPRGSITAKAILIKGLGKGQVAMTHGWDKSSANELTDDGVLDPISAFPAYRGFLCNIEKV